MTPAPTSGGARRRPPVPDGVAQHRDWLSLIDITGPFLSLPVLRRIWPTLDPLDKPARERLRRAHTTWLDDPAAGQHTWIRHVLTDLLGWGDALLWPSDPGAADTLAPLAVDVDQHDTRIVASFALVDPTIPLIHEASDGPTTLDGPITSDGPTMSGGALAGASRPTRPGRVKPESVRLLGLVVAPGQSPTGRIAGEAWSATPVDRAALACRQHGVELALVTSGRQWALVWAPRGGVTSTAVFDAISWPETAERDVVRAFVSLLCRRRFFGVPDDETLVPLLKASLGSQEEITEALGVQVRQAVELLVAAFGRWHVADRARGGPGLPMAVAAGEPGLSAHDVYRGAVAVMMRIVFLLYAEERGLLPADNELYAGTYSVGRLCADLEGQISDGATEDDLEQSSAAWHRLRALFTAVHTGVDHPRLRMHAHGGSLFDPDTHPWLPLGVDDRTVLHMLRAVQHVQVGSGRSRERRTLSFRSLDVEQIGYVYEGLLSYDARCADVDEIIVGLVGKEGLEAETTLADLEALAFQHRGRPLLAAAITEKWASSGIGSVRSVEKRLTPLDATEREEARKALLAVTRGDYPTAERLLPYYGLLRRDLRDQPVVVLEGGLYVTESPLRRNTGTHYTPRFLAEEVANNALEPLVYAPGPLQTADTRTWQLRSSTEILALKVADIAMGSAAFLVAAARYLGARLVEAWTLEGDPRALGRFTEVETDGITQAGRLPTGLTGRSPLDLASLRPADTAAADAEEDGAIIEARRQIIEHCLYGADINEMAVEMAKLSLWLVSMDPHRPFTFLDDKLVAGDSLLGITSVDQLEHMHLDPARGREIHKDLFKWTAGIRELVHSVADERRALVARDGSTLDGLDEKAKLLADAQNRTTQLRHHADALIGATLTHAGRGDRGQNNASVAAAKLIADLTAGTTTATDATRQIKRWLATDHVPGSFTRTPIHWPLVFPEVFETGGFDSIIGNPPFLGGTKITGALGVTYREAIIESIALDVRSGGRCDLVAYFLLRALSLLCEKGQIGLIATNTLVQGDTREVGIEQVLAGGSKLRRAVKSRAWPSSSVSLEYCGVWITREPQGHSVSCWLDERPVPGITSALEPVSRVTGNPNRLKENQNICFEGSKVTGMGFVLDGTVAEELIQNSSRNSAVIFPYLNGDDLNSRPGLDAGRWIINFYDRSESEAATFADVFDIIESKVKPERQRRHKSGEFVLRNPLPQRYWQYADKRPGMNSAISGLKMVTVITKVSRTVMPAIVPTGQVFAHKLGVFASDDKGFFAFLSCSIHYWWAASRASTMKADLNYSPSDVFETLPLPDITENLRNLGERLEKSRQRIMLSRQIGLTKAYGLAFDSACKEADVIDLREIHKMIDYAAIRAYGWDDMIERGLDHGFHPAGKYTRYTIGPWAQREVLDRLLELNHARYAEEVAAGLHEKGAKKKGARAKPVPTEESGATLFDL